VTLGYIRAGGAGIRRIPGAAVGAGHNLSDFLALLLSLVAVYFQSRRPIPQETYGYHRAGVLAALANATSLVAVSFLFSMRRFTLRPDNCMPA
jgi:cobalt-zinc-cadmium efflux system protein